MKLFEKKVVIGVGIAIAVVLLLLIVCYVKCSHYFSLEYVKSQAFFLKNFVEQHTISAVIVFIMISTLLIAFTLPVIGPVAVIGGFLFGLLPATLYTLVAAVIGAAISFFMVRYAMGYITKHQNMAQLEAFKKQLDAYGHTYLITLQLITVVPSFVINTVAVFAGVPFTTFMWTTAVGSFPVIMIYAFAGRQLYMIQSWRDILSFNMLLLLILLALLALLPMIVKKIRRTKQEEAE